MTESVRKELKVCYPYDLVSPVKLVLGVSSVKQYQAPQGSMLKKENVHEVPCMWGIPKYQPVLCEKLLIELSLFNFLTLSLFSYKHVLWNIS